MKSLSIEIPLKGSYTEYEQDLPGVIYLVSLVTGVKSTDGLIIGQRKAF